MQIFCNVVIFSNFLRRVLVFRPRGFKYTIIGKHYTHLNALFFCVLASSYKSTQYSHLKLPPHLARRGLPLVEMVCRRKVYCAQCAGTTPRVSTTVSELAKVAKDFSRCIPLYLSVYESYET
jgi:hypothetical protein